MNILGWFPIGLLIGLISLQSMGLLRVFSKTTVQINICDICSIRALVLVSFFLSFFFFSLFLSLYFWLIHWSAEASCVTQGILASLLLSLSHRRLWTTRFWSIKGPTSGAQNRDLVHVDRVTPGPIEADGSNKLFPQKIRHTGAPDIQNGEETTRTPGGRNSNTDLKIFRKHRPWWHQPYDLPTWGQIKTLTNKVKNLISQQGMP